MRVFLSPICHSVMEVGLPEVHEFKAVYIWFFNEIQSIEKLELITQQHYHHRILCKALL